VLGQVGKDEIRVEQFVYDRRLNNVVTLSLRGLDFEAR
jgi:hypothetical protein